jgi:hypothetical protein
MAFMARINVKLLNAIQVLLNQNPVGMGYFNQNESPIISIYAEVNPANNMMMEKIPT